MGTAIRRRPGHLVFGICLVFPAALKAFEPPSAAAFRSAFEAEFPKAGANAAALKLETLAATLGIDLAPAEASKRSHPTVESKARFVGAGAYIDSQAQGADERISPPSAILEEFFTEHLSTLDAVKSLLLSSEPRWEIDVTPGARDPMPNFLGQVQLQKLLLSRALLDVRAGQTDEALRTLEASWRLNESLADRPEWISHLIVPAVARLQAAVLRKVDSPAWGWADRLRDKRLFAGYLAAIQNDFWRGDADDLTGEAGARGRVVRRVAEAVGQGDLCRWTPQNMDDLWTNIVAQEISDDSAKIIAEIQAPSLKDGFFRWRRFLIDAELTAIVLDARAERAASRRHAWPVVLMTGRGVCPEGRWSYHVGQGGTAVFRLDGDPGESGSSHVALPLSFVAGAPAPIRRSPSRPSNPVS